MRGCEGCGDRAKMWIGTEIRKKVSRQKMIEHDEVRDPKNEWKVNRDRMVWTVWNGGVPRWKNESERMRMRWRAGQLSDHFDFAISRAALIRGASVRNGSDSLKNGCWRTEGIRCGVQCEVAILN